MTCWTNSKSSTQVQWLRLREAVLRAKARCTDNPYIYICGMKRLPEIGSSASDMMDLEPAVSLMSMFTCVCPCVCLERELTKCLQ